MVMRANFLVFNGCQANFGALAAPLECLRARGELRFQGKDWKGDNGNASVYFLYSERI